MSGVPSTFEKEMGKDERIRFAAVSQPLEAALGRAHSSRPGGIRFRGCRIAQSVADARFLGSEISLRSYAVLRGDRGVNDLLLKRVLWGIDRRNYEAAAETIPGAIGLSGWTVSRDFIQASAAKLGDF